SMAPSEKDIEEVSVPGVLAPRDDVRVLKTRIAKLLGTSPDTFPGSQPVSFSKKHLQALKEKNYFVCEKSDGIRCLLYMTEHPRYENRPSVYLFDRKMNFYHVEKIFYPVENDKSGKKYHVDTLLDGELVLDIYPGGKKQLRYLVFDCLACDGIVYMSRLLDKRLGIFAKSIQKPLDEYTKTHMRETAIFPFLTSLKKMELGHGILKLFNEVIPRLRHGNDGLIFTCTETPYVSGTDQSLLKWKPKEMNTIDFMLKLEFAQPEEGDIDYSAMPEFQLGVWEGRNMYSFFAFMYVDEKEWEKLKSFNVPLSERIVECYLDDENRWRFLRFRDDKRDANHISTVKSVLQSIEDGVSKEDLLKEMPIIREAYYNRKKPSVTKRKLDETSNDDAPAIKKVAKESEKEI
nr:Chain A, mRNA-capping enzyme subunit alpha [Schizosaccharomyces pombe 972h-]4PZ6_B Chain B, mRNA-capping enzyme subunit alpha [Schizosaccharomyces pombe 972h-]